MGRWLIAACGRRLWASESATAAACAAGKAAPPGLARTARDPQRACAAPAHWQWPLHRDPRDQSAGPARPPGHWHLSRRVPGMPSSGPFEPQARVSYNLHSETLQPCCQSSEAWALSGLLVPTLDQELEIPRGRVRPSDVLCRDQRPVPLDHHVVVHLAPKTRSACPRVPGVAVGCARAHALCAVDCLLPVIRWRVPVARCTAAGTAAGVALGDHGACPLHVAWHAVCPLCAALAPGQGRGRSTGWPW
jgi:hypothetical protein